LGRKLSEIGWVDFFTGATVCLALRFKIASEVNEPGNFNSCITSATMRCVAGTFSSASKLL